MYNIVVVSVAGTGTHATFIYINIHTFIPQENDAGVNILLISSMFTLSCKSLFQHA